MPTVKDLLDYLNQMDPDTVVVLDAMAAQDLPLDSNYMTCSVMLAQIEEGAG